jgi:uncharacterized protein (DUF58 family)
VHVLHARLPFGLHLKLWREWEKQQESQDLTAFPSPHVDSSGWMTQVSGMAEMVGE